MAELRVVICGAYFWSLRELLIRLSCLFRLEVDLETLASAGINSFASEIRSV